MNQQRDEDMANQAAYNARQNERFQGLSGVQAGLHSAAPHVYTAINQVTAIMAGEGIAKGRKNEQQGYRFRGIDDIYCALARHLATAKLCILPRVLERTMTERPTKSGGVSTYVVLTVAFDLVSAVDGSTHTITTMGEAMDTADKATNKAMSAAMKYACLLAFQIPTEGDNDTDASHHEKAPPTLEKQLEASVAWGAWEAAQIKGLRAASTPGALLSVWTAVHAAVKDKAPEATVKRLTAVKDEMKAKLGNGHASAEAR